MGSPDVLAAPGRLGFIPGIVATVMTLFYAAKQIEVVGNQFAKVEKMGFTDRLQKVGRHRHSARSHEPL